MQQKYIDYICKLYVNEDQVQSSIGQGLLARGFPNISVPKEVGKLLYLLAKTAKASKALELGTLGGYSTIWLAKALPRDGILITIDNNPDHLEFAKENLNKAGLFHKVKLLCGDAQVLLAELHNLGETFDLFFIDADKPAYPSYLEYCLSMACPGALILADNLFQRGRIFDPQDDSPSKQAILQFNEIFAQHTSLESIILPIGDGLGFGRVIVK